MKTITLEDVMASINRAFDEQANLNAMRVVRVFKEKDLTVWGMEYCKEIPRNGDAFWKAEVPSGRDAETFKQNMFLQWSRSCACAIFPRTIACVLESIIEKEPDTRFTFKGEQLSRIDNAGGYVRASFDNVLHRAVRGVEYEKFNAFTVYEYEMIISGNGHMKLDVDAVRKSPCHHGWLCFHMKNNTVYNVDMSSIQFGEQIGHMKEWTGCNSNAFVKVTDYNPLICADKLYDTKMHMDKYRSSYQEFKESTSVLGVDVHAFNEEEARIQDSALKHLFNK